MWSPDTLTSAFEAFLRQSTGADGALAQLRGILSATQPSMHYAVRISASDVSHFNHHLGNSLMQSPQRLLPRLDEALRHVQQQLLADPMNAQRSWSAKHHVHARMSWIPDLPEYSKENVSSLRSTDVGRLLCVAGTVVRCGSILMRESSREYECSRCHHKFEVFAAVDQKGLMSAPTRCPSSHEGPCPSTKFRCVEGSTKCTDYQEIKIQDQVQKLAVGSIPRNLLVILENDLADTLKAGDDARVIGVLQRRWNKGLFPDARPDIEMILVASFIRVENQDKSSIEVDPHLRDEFARLWNHNADTPFRARDTILRSVCPQIYGLAPIKLAVALALIGGSARTDAHGTRTRGECHLLLIGDPGIGKSQFLKFACKMSPRSVLTTGVGSTSAGLTVAAVKDAGGEWCLEAGALVLADRGVCAIDELSSIREHDRATIHEAMEQQTLSVAKAGLVCKLDTRTTVIAATNPKGKYSKSDSIALNTTLATPLLSRFDLIFVLRDTQRDDWDRAVSSHILRDASGDVECRKRVGEGGGAVQAAWALDKLQMYFHQCRQQPSPEMTEQAGEVLRLYYQRQRQAGQRAESRTTIRMLESLVRLSQAHAKLCCRSTVEVLDAVVVVDTMENSIDGAAGDMGESEFEEYSALSDFHEDPDEEYARVRKRVLNMLGLNESKFGSRPNQHKRCTSAVDTAASTESAEVVSTDTGFHNAHQRSMMIPANYSQCNLADQQQEGGLEDSDSRTNAASTLHHHNYASSAPGSAESTDNSASSCHWPNRVDADMVALSQDAGANVLQVVQASNSNWNRHGTLEESDLELPCEKRLRGGGSEPVAHNKYVMAGPNTTIQILPTSVDSSGQLDKYPDGDDPDMLDM